MTETVDCIVVGSGMSGAHAAQTLLEEGRSVLMLDVGVTDETYRQLVPQDDFLTVRRHSPDQHRYFLGDDFEGIPWGSVRHTLTPPRQFVTRHVDYWLPHESDEFNPMESLAYGGLGNAWGAGCAAYSTPELEAMGVDPGRMRRAYQVISDRIGVCADDDDVAPFCSSGLTGVLPPMRLDSCIDALYRSYARKRGRLNARGIYVGRPPLAVLTEERDGRSSAQYRDMEFWTDAGESVYRPWVTVNALRSHPGFTYRPHHLVTRFAEDDGSVTVEALNTESNESVVLRCRTLLLSPGTLGTARIVLRSQPDISRLPILTNPYSLVPCVFLRRLGATQDTRKTGMGQLVMYEDESGARKGMSMLSMYTYRSLLLFKLAKEAPFDLQTARQFMRGLTPSLIIASINHPDTLSVTKYLERRPDGSSPTGDTLFIKHESSPQEHRDMRRAERRMFRALRTLGAFPLKKQDLPPGSSVHYVGCLPMREQETRGHLLPNGRLAGTRNVYVADGSGFRYLPANGPTFSIMAHAHLVAKAAAACQQS